MSGVFQSPECGIGCLSSCNPLQGNTSAIRIRNRNRNDNADQLARSVWQRTYITPELDKIGILSVIRQVVRATDRQSATPLIL